MADIALSSGIRTNLLTLQQTASLIGSTQARLASGLKVNSAIDDASAFFTAAGARGRASDLSARKNEIGEAIQTIKAASNASDSISMLIDTAKG
ncbi:MAG: ABC transporter substrate-binding protein, partial [Gemmatimonadales bacterium]